MKFSFTYKEGVILQIRDILLGPTRITRCILNTSDDNDPFHRVVGVDRKVCVCVVFFRFIFEGVSFGNGSGNMVQDVEVDRKVGWGCPAYCYIS